MDGAQAVEVSERDVHMAHPYKSFHDQRIKRSELPSIARHWLGRSQNLELYFGRRADAARCGG